MAKDTIEHVEMLHPDVTEAVPNLGLGDLLRYLPLVEKLITAFKSGTGSFSTWTERGKRWVVVLDHEPKGDL